MSPAVAACSERSGCHCAQATISASAIAAAATAAAGGECASLLRFRRPGAWRSAGAPRPATHPAHSSAITASPGTNHVQSIAEWTVKVTTTATSVSRPIRSAAPAPGARARWGPVARTADTHQKAAASRLSTSPAMPRSASVWKT